ncbi:hypothetical protein FHT82_005598 [Rhizobium sp. BK275]|uniref:hypothetical protein n=1 Tax=Rhizobium sp. BK275 TaxID=2587077 RepID=UPI001619BC03|nr:hypothetical protein [Rhizobium sp. BK275]MBB3392809.1 hypothetical protein [Rhizobium sp. BK275]
MGYHLSSLASLPIDDDVDLYIFIVGNGIRSRQQEELRGNFLNIAREIGQDAVIVDGFDENLFSKEVISRYFGENQEGLEDLFPALVLTDTHPDHLHLESFKIIISLRRAEQKYGDLAAFFSALVRFAQGRNPDFLRDVGREESDVATLLERANRIFMLQPNFIGIGVNINAAIEIWLNRMRGVRVGNG